jgi:hypothetical protein
MIRHAANLLHSVGYGTAALDVALKRSSEAEKVKEKLGRQRALVQAQMDEVEAAQKARAEEEALAARTQAQENIDRVVETNKRIIAEYEQSCKDTVSAAVEAWCKSCVHFVAPYKHDYEQHQNQYIKAGACSSESAIYESFKTLVSAEGPIITVAPVFLQHFQAKRLFHNGMTWLSGLQEVCLLRVLYLSHD